MFTRKPFTWECQLLSDAGQTLSRKFKSYWSPDQVSLDSVALAAAAQETVAAKHQHKFVGISAALMK